MAGELGIEIQSAHSQILIRDTDGQELPPEKFKGQLKKYTKEQLCETIRGQE